MGEPDAKARLLALEAVFAALAHPARRQILLTVHFRGGSMTAGEIAGRFACAWPTTTRHLRVLEEAGLLRHERHGRTRVYRIEGARLDVAQDWFGWFEKGGAPVMAKTLLTNLREICLSLPDTKETLTWGTPHFRVGEKIFCGCGEEKGRPVVGFKLEREHADVIIGDPRFSRAPYVGHKGWVSMDASGVKDWGEVRALILESYRLIAPKRSLAKLGDAPTPSKRPQGKPGRRRQ